ncbi:hypothetical protein OESDEN_05470 [Oesophagostomum dentatum]|uniref:Large ribosomal subunit protein mL49 n=1 Tax=Oesophagostomum dentatum TaxID=61180 RepID=A0A0B1TFK7_OESDE|nr:hypothetical protein OESDEN_05470 [Oesophagostomum dentatum]
MLRPVCRSVPSLGRNSVRLLATPVNTNDDESKPWLNPWKHAIPKRESTATSFEEVKIDWSYIERLMPHDVVPPLPKHASYPTPSGWQPPQDPPPDLPYYVRRKRDHTLPLYLNRRRDLLNEKTLDFDYVELVTMKGIDGDVFACEKDLCEFLEAELGKPVATHVDELKGRIVIKGADRSAIEKFLFSKGF